MKKIIMFIVVGLSCLLTFTSCSAASANSEGEEFSNLKFADWGEVNRMGYDTLDDLENDSDIIVVGKFKENAEQKEIFQYDETFKKDVLSIVVSTNKINVSKVIKGDVKEGDSITIAQDYGVVEDQYVTVSRLTPMLKGDEWIFFLTKNKSEIREGTYSCTGDNDGRYPLKNFSYKKIAFTDNEDYGVLNEEDFNEKIYNEILNKYSL